MFTFIDITYRIKNKNMVCILPAKAWWQWWDLTTNVSELELENDLLV